MGQTQTHRSYILQNLPKVSDMDNHALINQFVLKGTTVMS